MIAAETLKCSAIQALDVSRCGLHDMDLRGLMDAALSEPHNLQMLDVSDNIGRFPASIVPRLVGGLSELRELSLAGASGVSWMVRSSISRLLIASTPLRLWISLNSR